ncbi:MAG: c-type cytochrome [Bacteroidota bacterium]
MTGQSTPASAVAARSLTAVVGLAVVLATAACQRPPGTVPLDRALVLGGRSVGPDQLRRGAVAYTHYCRACHGDEGDGKGTAAPGLSPPPRDLRLGVYKFGAVPAGQLPTDADFRRIVRGGLHGTAMLAWDVPDPQLDDLIQYVKAFSPRWWTEQAGEPIALSRDPWAAGDPDAAITRGKRVYHGMAQCAVACHPAYVTRAEIFSFTQQLTGMRVEAFRPDLYAPVPKPSDFGVAIVPTDFTFSPLRAGETIPDIARTIAAGIGGTAMPTWKNVLPDADLWAMATYVRSLVVARGTAAAEALRAQLRTQAPWTPPPPPPPPPAAGAPGLTPAGPPASVP